jgi:deoxycytidine triphosphate deaminase
MMEMKTVMNRLMPVEAMMDRQGASTASYARLGFTVTAFQRDPRFHGSFSLMVKGFH